MMDDKLEEYLEESFERHMDELFALLRIPSVSADPAHMEDVRRCAQMVEERLEEAGLRTRMFETEGHPCVYGECLAAGADAPTVLIYGHYDVQPPDPLELWRNPPFSPVIEDGRIVARGATDDKGQMYCHIKAIEALRVVDGSLPLNVKVLIEGEEEVGSEHLEPVLTKYRDVLDADAVIISDTSMFGRGKPMITMGLRGLAYVEIRVSGPSHDLHSGLFGGAVPNPINGLADVISGMKDPDGRVTIEGFYENVRELTSAEREEMAALGHDEDALMTETGVGALPGEKGFTPFERLTARPTLDCNGIMGGYTGEGAKTVLPSRAMAKLSCRLVPDQEPDRIVAAIRDHVTKHLPEGLRAEVIDMHGGEPYLGDRQQPAMKAAASALERVWGVPPVFARSGGSIPVVASFKRILDTDSVLMGFGLEDDRLHSPNEKFEVENFRNGIRSAAWMLRELGKHE